MLFHPLANDATYFPDADDHTASEIAGFFALDDAQKTVINQPGLCPIAQVPTEVLTEIFKLVVASHGADDWPTQATLAAVCRRWYAIIDEVESLWPVVHYDLSHQERNHPLVRRWAARKSAPGLELHLHATAGVDLPKAVIFLERHALTIKSLYFKIDGPLYTYLLKEIHFPNLAHIDVSRGLYKSACPPLSVSGPLRSARIRDLDPTVLKCHWTSLRSLSISGVSGQEICSVLYLASGLVDLRAQILPTSQQYPAVFHGVLECLEIVELPYGPRQADRSPWNRELSGGLLGHLTLPALKDFTYSRIIGHRPSAAIDTMLTNSCARLEHLALLDPCRLQVGLWRSKAFTTTPLVVLHLGFGRPQDLLWLTNTLASPVLPTLQTLVLDLACDWQGTGPVKFTVSRVVENIYTRNAAMIRQASTVSQLGVPGPSSGCLRSLQLNTSGGHPAFTLYPRASQLARSTSFATLIVVKNKWEEIVWTNKL